MRKLIRVGLSALLLMTVLCACALAEETFDATLLYPASAAAPLAEDYVPDGLMQISSANEGVHLAASRSMLLKEEALTALYAMVQAAEGDGVTIYIRQAYRSYADEKRRYEMLAKTGEVAQQPGESSYQTGLSVTLVSEDWRTKELTADFASTDEAKWLAQHAAEYGFVLRYPAGKESVTGWSYEPWHYRYVGTAAAEVMAADGLCLEELIEQNDIELPAMRGTGKPASSAGTTVVTKPAASGTGSFDFDEYDPDGDEGYDFGDFDEFGDFEGDTDGNAPASNGKVGHSVPPVVDTSMIDPEDIGPDGDYEISLFGD